MNCGTEYESESIQKDALNIYIMTHATKMCVFKETDLTVFLA